MNRTFVQASATLPLLLLGAALILGGCRRSMGSSADGEGRLQLEGRVVAADAAAVENARVTVAMLQPDGTHRDLSDAAQTDARGDFRMDIERGEGLLLVVATRDGFAAKSLAVPVGARRMSLAPLTAESSVETDVYLALRSRAERDATIADVTALIDAPTAAEVTAGRMDVATLSRLVGALIAAQRSFLADAGALSGAAHERLRTAKQRCFAELQHHLSVARSPSDRAAAFRILDESLLDAYIEAGVPHALLADSYRAGLDALQREARAAGVAPFPAGRQAAILAAQAAAWAIEHSLEEHEALDEAGSRLLIDARRELMEQLRLAATPGDIDAAVTRYSTRLQRPALRAPAPADSFLLSADMLL